jgi:hypothetical protein
MFDILELIVSIMLTIFLIIFWIIDSFVRVITGGNYTIHKNKLMELKANDDFKNYINSPALDEIDSHIKKCVSAKSIYNMTSPDVISGFNIRKIKKGTNIYKSFSGFYTEDDIKKYQSKPDSLSYLGSKYLTYAISKSYWNSIVSYKAIKDIYLIDFFDEANLENIIKKINRLKKTIGQKKANDIIDAIRTSTGYQKTVKQQMDVLHRIYKWDEIWTYDKQLYPEQNYAYCNVRRRGNLNPIGTLKGNYIVDKWLFENVFKDIPILDGLIREQILSKIDENGVFYIEELAIKGNSLNEKTIIDQNDPVHWTNWAPADIPRSGLPMKNIVLKFMGTPDLSNEKFKMVHFYLDKNVDIVIPPISKYIMTFNINFFTSLSIRDDKTVDKVLNIINSISELQFFVLQEYTYNQQFETSIAEMGFKIFKTNNGSKQQRDIQSKLLFGIKNNFDCSFIEEPFVYYGGLNRNQIIIKFDNLTIIAAHIEAGGINASNVELNKKNNKRIETINTLIEKYKSDNTIILGCFDFEYGSKECDAIIDKGFMLINNDINKKTTPSLKSDMIFTNNPNILGNEIILDTNISDHLPVLQEILI